MANETYVGSPVILLVLFQRKGILSDSSFITRVLRVFNWLGFFEDIQGVDLSFLSRVDRSSVLFGRKEIAAIRSTFIERLNVEHGISMTLKYVLGIKEFRYSWFSWLP